MNTTPVSYATFKAVAVQRSLRAYWTAQPGATAYTIYCATDKALLQAEARNDDLADFEATLKPNGAEVGSPEEALVLATNAMAALSSPRTSDGKQIVLPNLFPGNVLLYYAGAGDHASNGRGQGPLFQLSSSAQEDKVLEWQFNDWLYLSGGAFTWKGGDIGDYLSLELYCPANSTSAASNNDGNCNLVGNVIVPAAGNGAYNIDLATAKPVPAFAAAADESTPAAPNGYWDWSDPATGKGTTTPSTTPGKALWHLIAADVPLARFAAKLPLLGDGIAEAQVPAIKPKKILPHWMFKLTMHNDAAKSLKLGWHLVTARIATTT